MLQREGEGWRLAWDPQRDPFPVLIGGEGWASELTAAESHALQRGLLLLCEQHHSLVDTLMAEETICLQFQCTTTGPGDDPAKGGASGTLWAALEGTREAWSLSFVLEPAPGLRGVEGSWSSQAAPSFVQAYSTLVGGPELGLDSEGA